MIHISYSWFPGRHLSYPITDHSHTFKEWTAVCLQSVMLLIIRWVSINHWTPGDSLISDIKDPDAAAAGSWWGRP